MVQFGGMPVGPLWTFVGLLQLMFGLAWMAAARLSDGLRRGLLAMAWFNLLTGASLMLLAWREGGGGFWTGTVPNLLQVVSYVLLWRAGSALTGAPDAWLAQRRLLLLACPAVLVLGSLPGMEQQRQAVSMLANIWVLVHGCIHCSRQLQWSGATGLALAMRVSTVFTVCALGTRALGGLLLGDPVDWEYRGSALLAWLLTAPIFAVNVLAAYHAFGRTVRDAERLARQDGLTGLADGRTLQAALADAWARRRPGRLPAVLELGVDQLPALRQSFGTAMADAVLAELAWKLRLALQPGDLLAHDGDGVFRVLLLGSRAPAARQLGRDLIARVRGDAGLHPEFGLRLTLSVGMAEAEPSDGGPADLLQRVHLRRQCAQLAGGDCLVDQPVTALRPQPGSQVASSS